MEEQMKMAPIVMRKAKPGTPTLVGSFPRPSHFCRINPAFRVSRAAVPAASAGVSPARVFAGETPVRAGEDACPTMRLHVFILRPRVPGPQSPFLSRRLAGETVSFHS